MGRNTSRYKRKFDLEVNGSMVRINGLFHLLIPCKSKGYFLNGFSVKTIVLVGIYNQQFQGTIILMVFDFQGIDMVYWGYNPFIVADSSE